MSKALKMIAAARKGQIRRGFNAEHDADEFHQNGELAQAACYYAWPHKWVIRTQADGLLGHLGVRHEYPVRWLYPATWLPVWAKRDGKSRLRQLAVAGALIAAEIDRLMNEEKEQ